MRPFRPNGDNPPLPSVRVDSARQIRRGPRLVQSSAAPGIQLGWSAYSTNEPWFEVYKVRPGVFAIYEPHQAEETICYLIVGTKQALLFDTGMGISDLQSWYRASPVAIIVLNSHTHNDHVGDNWQFATVYGMDTDFTRKRRKGSRTDAQAEIAQGKVCGDLPKVSIPKTYATQPWQEFARRARWLQNQSRRWPRPGNHRHARPYSGRHLPTRSRERTALHRRHLLSRAHLALSTRNRSRCLRGFRQAHRRLAAASQDRSRGAQYSRRRSFCPSAPGSGHRVGPCRQGEATPEAKAKRYTRLTEFLFCSAPADLPSVVADVLATIISRLKIHQNFPRIFLRPPMIFLTNRFVPPGQGEVARIFRGSRSFAVRMTLSCLTLVALSLLRRSSSTVRRPTRSRTAPKFTSLCPPAGNSSQGAGRFQERHQSAAPKSARGQHRRIPARSEGIPQFLRSALQNRPSQPEPASVPGSTSCFRVLHRGEQRPLSSRQFRLGRCPLHAEATLRSRKSRSGRARSGSCRCCRQFHLGVDSVQCRRLPEADKTARQAVVSNSNLASAYLLLAQIHLRQSNLTAVVSELDAYLRLDPEGPHNVEAHALRTEAQQLLAKRPSAGPVLAETPVKNNDR